MNVCIYSYVFFIPYFTVAEDIPICSSKQQVTVNVGDNAHLSCLFTYEKSSDNLQAIWMKKTEGSDDIVVHNQNMVETIYIQSTAIIQKTAMFQDWFQRGDASMNVTRVTPLDDGEYSCWIIQSPASLKTSTKCCTIRLSTTQEWKGDIKQVVVAWSLYIFFLSLCTFCLCLCRPQKQQADIYEV